MAEQLTAAESSKNKYGMHDAHLHDAGARMDMYRFLAAVYLQPPDEAIIRQLVDRNLSEQLALLFGKRITEPLYEMALDFVSRKALTELQREHMGLFSVPAGNYVTPFEDVYRGLRVDGNQERGPLLGDRAVAVKIIYRSTGAGLDKMCRELPTHVGTELSFMSFLCGQEKKCLTRNMNISVEADHQASDEAEIYRQWQLMFLHEHLTNWFPQLRRAIEEKAESRYFRCMAQLTQAFLDQDKDWLIRRFKSGMAVAETIKPGREQ